MNALEIQNLYKTYKNGVHALQKINLTIAPGEFYGILGPNGAGKSTLIGVVSSLVKKNSGTVKVFGVDIDQDHSQAKSFLGVVPQEPNFNVFHSCWNIVLSQAGFYGVPRPQAKEKAEYLFKKLGLWEKRLALVNQLSGGMKRRLMLIRALVGNPKILFLDEPTAGVDISQRRQLWDFLQEKNREGLTIILTTHYLEEAEHLCRKVAILDKGKIIEDSSTIDLLSKLEVESIILYSVHPISRIPRVEGYDLRLLEDGSLQVNLNRQHHLSDLLQILREQGIIVNRVRNKTNLLEESFLQMVDAHV